MAYIYKITNKVNNKIYIGNTNNFKRRKSQHISSLRKNKHTNIYLQNAWNKHGESNFKFEALEEIIEKLKLNKEQEYLDRLFPFGDHRYNISENTHDPLGKTFVSRICGICNNKIKATTIDFCISEC